MKSKIKNHKTIKVDGQFFKIDYTWSNIEKIGKMLKDEEVPNYIKPNLVMCMLTHDEFFRNVPTDQIMNLTEKYWTNYLNNITGAKVLSAKLTNNVLYKKTNAPNLIRKLPH